mgnify:CR=1 FL=1
MSKLQSKARDRSLGLITSITALRHTVLSKLFHLPKPQKREANDIVIGRISSTPAATQLSVLTPDF